MKFSFIKVGDYIRSYDFPHTTDYFKEGIVTAVDQADGAITFELVLESIDKEISTRNKGAEFVTPMEEYFETLYMTDRLSVLNTSVNRRDKNEIA